MTDSMTDEEIRENLLKLGMNIGPVVDSTRAFYRRKLAKLLGEITDEPAPRSSDTEGSASETEINEEKEEQIPDKLFSEEYVPPVQIRGRRSVNSLSGHSPPKPSYTSSNPCNSAPATGIANIALLVCIFLAFGAFLYVTLFLGGSTETAVGLK